MAVRLDWTDNATDEDGFRVERKHVGGSFVLIQTINTPDVESYIDPSGVVTDTYRVLAFNAFGDSPWSNEAVPGEQFVEDFAIYTSTQDFKNDPKQIYAEGNSSFAWFIDPAEGLDIDGFALLQALKYTYFDQTANIGDPPETRGRCGGQTISRWIRFNGPGVTGIPSVVTHIWAEWYVKYEDAFVTPVPEAWGCTTIGAQKMFFIMPQSGVPGAPAGRWDVNVGIFGARIDAHTPNGSRSLSQTPSVNPAYGQVTDDIFDGLWHRFRMEAKIPTVPGSAPGVYDGTADGIIRVWHKREGFADAQIVNATDVETSASGLVAFVLGANRNQGPQYDMSYWWGRVGAWTADPGW